MVEGERNVREEVCVQQGKGSFCTSVPVQQKFMKRLNAQVKYKERLMLIQSTTFIPDPTS